MGALVFSARAASDHPDFDRLGNGRSGSRGSYTCEITPIVVLKPRTGGFNGCRAVSTSG
jgi:hypothetical protein